MADVTVTVGADTSDLSSELAIAQRQLQLATREMQSFATQVVRGGSRADSARVALASWASEVDTARGRVRTLAEEVERYSQTTGFNRNQLMESTHVLRALFDEAAAGGNVFRGLAMEAGRIGQIFTEGKGGVAGTFRSIGEALISTRGALIGIGVAATAAAAAFAILELSADASRRRIASAMGSAVGAENYGNTVEGLKTIEDNLKKVSNLSDETAAEYAKALARVNDAGNATGQAFSNPSFFRAAASLLGTDADEAAKRLAAAFDEPATKGKALIESLGGLTAAESRELEEATRSNDRHRELVPIIEALGRTFKAAAEHAAELSTDQRTLIQRAGEALGALVGYRRTFDETRSSAMTLGNDAGKAFDGLTRSAEAMRHSVEDGAVAFRKLQEAGQSLLSGDLAAQIEKAQHNIDALRSLQPSGGATGDAAELIRQQEEFRPRAYWDVNHWRVGYGSDSKAGGTPGDVREGDTTTREEAERDLASRIAAIQETLEARIGASWARLSDRAKASLTSVFYNYGKDKNLPSIIGAARTGSDDNVATAIAALKENPDRRRQEAANILPTDSGRLNYDIGVQQEQIKRNQDLMAGGAAIQKEQIAAAERAAAGRADELEAARKLVDADKVELDRLVAIGATDATIGQARMKLAQDSVAMQAREREERKAQLAIDEARADQMDYETRHKARAGAIQIDINSAPSDAARMQAQAAMERENDQYEADRAAKAQQTEDRVLAAQEAGFDRRAALLQADVRMRRVSQTQATQIELQIQEERYGAEVAYWNKIAELWGKGTREYDQAQQRLRQLDLEYSQKRLQITLSAQEQIAATYQQTMQSASQTIGSAMTGIITGHQSMRQAISQILTQMLGRYVQYGVAMVLTNSGAMGQTIAQVITGEAAKTAAVASGTAARTGLATSGAAAGEAVNLASILKNITASAGEAFAGVFGFLAPVMGPLAAGPAAAAQATVLGMAHFDKGSWALPSDMIAQVHKGEMIVPAAQTPWAQSLMANAAGGGSAAGAGVTVHHATHFNISAIDAQGVKSFLKNNSRQILRAINEGVREGSHLGLSHLG